MKDDSMRNSPRQLFYLEFIELFASALSVNGIGMAVSVIDLACLCSACERTICLCLAEDWAQRGEQLLCDLNYLKICKAAIKLQSGAETKQVRYEKNSCHLQILQSIFTMVNVSMTIVV